MLASSARVEGASRKVVEALQKGTLLSPSAIGAMDQKGWAEQSWAGRRPPNDGINFELRTMLPHVHLVVARVVRALTAAFDT